MDMSCSRQVGLIVRISLDRHAVISLLFSQLLLSSNWLQLYDNRMRVQRWRWEMNFWDGEDNDVGIATTKKRQGYLKIHKSTMMFIISYFLPQIWQIASLKVDTCSRVDWQRGPCQCQRCICHDNATYLPMLSSLLSNSADVLDGRGLLSIMQIFLLDNLNIPHHCHCCFTIHHHAVVYSSVTAVRPSETKQISGCVIDTMYLSSIFRQPEVGSATSLFPGPLLIVQKQFRGIPYVCRIVG